eukprot:8331400-Lingulodinium_polyedra.AAC.1
MFKEWVVGTQCIAHAAHNSLKWGMSEAFPGHDYITPLWIVFASLRNSAGLLSDHLPQWVAEH